MRLLTCRICLKDLSISGSKTNKSGSAFDRSIQKVELGLARALDLARKFEIPFLTLILTLPDGTVWSRGTRCGRTVNKIAALTSHSHGRAVRPGGRACIGRMHLETLQGTREVPVYPPPRVPMMDACRYRSLFGQSRVVPPSPQRDASEPSEEDFEEHDNTQTSSDTSHSSVDISSVDAS
ncbi:hypothetical protein PIB30_063158 [Stylosanthes scabra]|uniref:Uncharacterized protein n=1 Tax=Stylosanthes scabra TaxID=79078 RepID=A0ABU6WJN2_9FABA|nr:hypothetical protein [Stylosanthes scabra]